MSTTAHARRAAPAAAPAHQEKSMNCPRCHDAPLLELDRDGVTIDRCDRCRGIWLDRGELEKLLARARDAEAGPRDLRDAPPRAAAGPAHRDDDDDDRRRDDDDRRRRRDDDDDDDRGRYPGRKRSWWDIFD
ncbi:MAG: zf-TFIIB domain-containing protein [Kofleriaceae bacterium]|nr:zf-TFIIB domain-containing protein [Kofleriaceae bacterium]